MKLRVKEQYVRFRLTKTDVKKLAEEGLVEEHAQFATCTLTYSIVRTNQEFLSTDFDGQRIVLSMPGPMIDELASNESVGFSEERGDVKILVEKDFICLENSLEDQSDNYAYPNS